MICVIHVQTESMTMGDNSVFLKEGEIHYFRTFFLKQNLVI